MFAISRVVKQFLWLVIPATIAMGMLAYWVNSEEASKQRMTLTSGEIINVNFAHAAIERELDQTITDLHYLANISTDKDLEQITQNFSLFAEQKQIYDQIRFISVDGEERVRINFRDGKVYVVPKEGLQSKKDRYYFKETIRLQKGAFFISPLDLNVERGIVERPLKPVIRLGMVVFNETGAKRGVIILNFLARDMLKRFRRYAKDVAGSFRLINRNGYWLSHELWEKEWGFMLERDDRIQNEAKEEWTTILRQESGQFLSVRGLYSFTTVHPVNINREMTTSPDYFWKIVSFVPNGVMLAQKYHQIRLTLFIAGPIYIAMIFVCGWLAHSRVVRKDMETALRVSEEKKRAIIDMSVDAIITADERGTVEAWNPAAERIFGYRAEDAIGQNINNLIIPEDMREKHRGILKKFSQGDTIGILGKRVERIAVRNDHSTVSTDVAVAAQDVDGKKVLTAFIQDLTARKKTEERDQLIKAVFDETMEAISVCDADYKIIMVNKAFTSITGYRLRDVLGKDPNCLASEKCETEFFKNMWNSIDESGCWSGEIWNRHKNGREYPVRTSISTVRSKTGKIQNYIAVFNDISEEKAVEDAIRKQAHYDALTGVPNRFLFMDRLDRAVVEGKRSGEVFALLFIDLDRFKLVNDTFGHKVGDEMLVEVSRRLEAGVRKSDTVARLAGDEFTVISHYLKDEDDLKGVIEKVRKSLCGPWSYEGTVFEISGSIGCALFPHDGENATTLLQAADMAMYKAKQSK